MPNDRRRRVEGGCYFFTVNLRDRRSDLLVAEIAALRGAVRPRGRALRSTSMPRCRRTTCIAHGRCRPKTSASPFGGGRSRPCSRDRSRARKPGAHPWSASAKPASGNAGFGAHDRRRPGSRRPHGRHPFHPGEARACGTRRRLAVFEFSQVCDARAVSDRLGDRGFWIGRHRRAVVTCDGGLKPTLRLAVALRIAWLLGRRRRSRIPYDHRRADAPAWTSCFGLNVRVGWRTACPLPGLDAL